MPQASLNLKRFDFTNARDSIVIVNALGDLPGGRTLDVTNYEGDVIYAGTVIAKKQDNGNDVYFPLSITESKKPYEQGATFSTLSSGETAVGILKVSIPKDMPIAAIVTLGQIKEKAMPAAMPATVKKALNFIQFI